MDKREQRQIIRDRISELSLTEKFSYSHRVCEKLLRQPEVEGARVIMSYLATDSEVNVDEFNRIMADKGVVICYPVIRGDDMQAYYNPAEEFVLNGYGIREPNKATSILMDREAIDLVIVPCVGFDEKLNRLGHGKGYYDRFLTGMEADRVAVAFEAQKLDSVVTDEHDVRMNKVITDDAVYRNISLI